MPTPKIKDIAVAAQVLEGINPVGEAPKKGETLPSMGTTDRVNPKKRI